MYVFGFLVVDGLLGLCLFEYLCGCWFVVDGYLCEFGGLRYYICYFEWVGWFGCLW